MWTPPRSWGQILGLLIWTATSVVAVLALLPPHISDDAPGMGEFSSTRAMSHVEALAAVPRPVGSPGHAKARSYLLDTLRGLNLEVSEQDTHFASLIAGNIVSSDVHNVIARLRGTSASRDAILFAAHYDSVPSGPGASDDGFGVATLLETARALASLPRLRNDILLLFSDAEEVGLLGSQAFVTEGAARGDVKVALNFDARGTHGAVTMFDTSANNDLLVRALAEASPYIVASSFVSKLAQALPNDTDASAFKRAGIPTYSFAYADGLEHYHRFTDVARAMDPRSLAHGGSYALSLARYLGGGDLRALARAGSGDVIYFDLLGRSLVSYSRLAARVLAAVTLVLFALSLLRARRGGLLLAGVARSVRDIALAVVGAVLTAGAMQLIVARFTPLYFLMARAKLFVPAIMLASSAFVVYLLGRRTGPRRVDELAYGGALLFGSILLILAIAMPELSAPFQWSLAFALAGMSIGGLLDSRPFLSELARYALLAPACLVMTQAAYATLVAAGATMPFIPALFAALLLVLILPVLNGSNQGGTRRASMLLVLASLLLVGAVATTCHYDKNEPSASSLLYGFDADSGKAIWFTLDHEIDARVASKIPLGLNRNPVPAFLPSDVAVFSAAAVPLVRQPARIEQERSEAIDGGRLVEFAVHASADARCWELWQEPGPNAPVIVDEQIDGARVPKFVRFSPELDAKLMRIVTGDSSRLGWHMMHCGAGERAVALAFRLAGPGDLALRLVELVDGLPASDQVVSNTDSTPAIGRAQGSDVSRVSRLLRL